MLDDSRSYNKSRSELGRSIRPYQRQVHNRYIALYSFHTQHGVLTCQDNEYCMETHVVLSLLSTVALALLHPSTSRTLKDATKKLPENSG